MDRKREILRLGVFIAIVATVAMAALDTYDGITYTEILVPTGTGVTNLVTASTGSAVSVAGAEGIGAFVLQVSKPAHDNPLWTNTILVQHCATSGGTYGNLTNSAGTAVALSIVTNTVGDVSVIKCDAGILSNYVRTIWTTNGDTGTASCVFVHY